jgi:hypothetical protein
MLFFGARANVIAGNNQIVIGSGSTLDGAIYFPASPLLFQANSTLNGCPQIIANRVTLFGGTWTLNGPCTAPGIRPIVASRTVRLTQ